MSPELIRSADPGERIRELEAALLAALELAEERRIEVAELTTIIAATEHRLVTLEQEVQAREKALRRAHEEELADKRSEAGQLAARVQDLHQELKAALARAEAKVPAPTAEAAQVRIRELEATIDRLREDQAAQQDELAIQVQRNERLEAEVAKRRLRCEQLEGAAAHLQKQQSTSLEDFWKVSSDLFRLRAEHADLQQECNALRRQVERGSKVAPSNKSASPTAAPAATHSAVGSGRASDAPAAHAPERHDPPTQVAPPSADHTAAPEAERSAPTPPVVLIADDNPGQTLMVGTLLRRSGYAFLEARDGATALAIARDKQPDLILLDVVMGDEDGFKACRNLKNDPSTAHIPVVFVTSKTSESDRYWGLSMGAVGFVTKPISPEALVETVARFTQAHEAR